MKLVSIVLAAGKGTRMKSTQPKVLHSICGRPMIYYALKSAQASGAELTVVVIGHAAEAVKEYLGTSVQYAVQEEQLGTGHAVLAASHVIPQDVAYVLVTNGDMPLLTEDTLRKLVDTQKSNQGPLSLVTMLSDDSFGFGRIVRAEDGSVVAIVEEVQCSPEQLKINELNVGAYCFDAKWLWDVLPRLPLSPKGEYYLTDVVGIAVQDGHKVAAFAMEDNREALGINTRIHLAEAEALMQRRILERHMLNGVTVINPASTYIEDSVTIGMDTTLQPNTFLRGETSIGENCVIGPNSIIMDCKVGNDCVILAAVMEKAIVEDGVDMGPFARLRKGAHLGPHVHIGNFGEVKDSYLGEGTKMGHFSYIGNATIGKDVNIGAGTITCNYDGEKKHATVIGDRVFIGSDTMLVAPLHIEDDARTGAGAVVLHDVPAGEIVVGVPAKPIRMKKNK
ncbi:MAG TPA: bifunctional UDP-N-acetylglucosamine diphosphorylase/glucosamine-1-phosphate N-acetyltransferase GlmU [Anaerolineaceae bacterium]|nr:bifunctional UDP-N-acetylglucosamine diphosphorylase/glucosamine-1-phosphate N-acetyltransferase GlmU [Anaerolineaceae bacterium]